MRPWHLFSPDESSLVCKGISISSEGVLVTLRSVAETAHCPRCAQPSTAIHSHYQRALADLPWQGEQVHLKLKVRKFFCRNAACSQSIFTERLPCIVAPHARQTQRLREFLGALGICLGGQGGARLAKRSGIVISGTSLLRVVRRLPLPPYPSPTVVGVDDWSYRRGHRYGSIVCDLERHRPLDLLPERSAESLAQWLWQHPGIQTISRDRADDYMRGATLGAPQAIQVADRWHLLRNLRDALMRVMDRYRREVRAAAQQTMIPAPKEPAPPLRAKVTEIPRKHEVRVTRRQELKAIKRQNRWERYHKIKALHQQGLSQREIAKRAGVNRETVGRYVHSQGFLELARGVRGRAITPFVAYLQKRWQEGCHNGRQLHKELQSRGFRGSSCAVYRFLAPWRNNLQYNASQKPAPTLPEPSSKLIAVWILKRSEKRAAQEQAFLDHLSRENPGLKTTITLATTFVQIMRHRQVSALPSWLQEIKDANPQHELQRFAKGLRDDLAAVGAAIALPWSNGQVEGQINRLKLIKRQMYGRGKFDLLRCRFLGAA